MNFLCAKMIYNIFVKCLVFYNVNLYMCIYDLFHILLHLRHNYESTVCMYVRVCIYIYIYVCMFISMYDHSVGGRILKWISQAKCCGSVEWMEVAQDTVHWQVSVSSWYSPLAGSCQLTIQSIGRFLSGWLWPHTLYKKYFSTNWMDYKLFKEGSDPCRLLVI